MEGSEGRIEKVEAHYGAVRDGPLARMLLTYRGKATYVDDLISLSMILQQ
jgi:hypothetical protein